MIKFILNGIVVIFLVGLIFALASAFSSDKISGRCSVELLNCLENSLNEPSYEKFLSASQCVWHNILCVLKQIYSYIKGF